MKKIYWIIFLIIIAILAIYLNRSYAYIYDGINNGNLIMPEKNQTYTIGNNKDGKNITYVALGDSLTSGAGSDSYQEYYSYLIAKKLFNSSQYEYTGGVNIILRNRSELGYKSVDIKNVFLPLAITDRPDIVTLLVGVNDVHNNISKEEFQNNYEEIIQHLKNETFAKIYLINIPFIGSNKLILPPYNYYFDLKTKELNEVIKNLAQKYNLKYIDLYSPTAEEFKKSDSYYSKDLFHPSAKGYAFWADIIYDFNK